VEIVEAAADDRRAYERAHNREHHDGDEVHEKQRTLKVKPAVAVCEGCAVGLLDGLQ